MYDFISFAFNQKNDIQNFDFLKVVKAKKIHKLLKKYSRNVGVGLNDSIFDLLINSFKQAIIKDVKFLP